MTVDILEEQLARYVSDTLQLTFGLYPVQIASLPPDADIADTIHGLVHLVGIWSGSVSVVVSIPLASFAAKVMFQEEDISSEDMCSVVAELANMAGGSIKGIFSSMSALSCPKTNFSSSYALSFAETVVVAEVMFECVFETKAGFVSGYIVVRAHESPLIPMLKEVVDTTHLL